MFTADRVSDGSAYANQVIRVEISVVGEAVVVLNVIVVNLGAHENMVPDVIADAAAEMLHEVIGADVVRIARGRSSRSVKAGIAGSDPSHKIESELLTDMRLVEQVEVGEDRTIV